MSKTLTISLVALASGGIDQDASKQAFADALDNYCAQHDLEQESIGEAVHALFDRPDLARGARLNMPYVVSQTLTALNASAANFKTLSERVAQYVRDNAGERESGATFGIGKGKGGGVCRWADVPVKPETDSK
jgi:nucleoid-associated protein YejK